MIHHGKLNWAALIDRGDVNYWYTLDELYRICEQVGLEINALGTRTQIQAGKMCTSKNEIMQEKMEGIMYLVCRKK